VTVLDAYAIIAALLDEPAKPAVDDLLREGAPKLSAINLAEVLDKLVRGHGHDYDDVLERVYWLGAGGLEIVDPDLEIAGTAGFLRQRHYDRRTRAISMADCFALATASILAEPIATADPAMAAVARYEEIEMIALPDSTGRRPV